MQTKIISICLLIAIVFISTKIKAQTVKIDSLENLLKKHTNEDTIRINLLNDIALNLLHVNSNKIVDYADEAIELSDKINFKKGKAESLRCLARYFRNNRNHQKALNYFQEALIIYEEIGNEMILANIYSNIGSLCRKRGNYPIAFDYYMKSLMIYKELGKEKETSTIWNNIGIIYEEEDNYPKAFEYFQKSLNIYEEIGHKNGISISLSNIGNIYKKQKNYFKALEYYKKALKIDKERGNKKLFVIDLHNVGEIHKIQGDYTKALEIFLKALDMSKDLRNKAYITCVLYYNISDVYIQMSRYEKALIYCNKGLEVANEFNLINNQIEIYKQLSEIYATTKNFKKAYQNHLIYQELNDSIFSNKNIRNIRNLELQYEKDKDKLVVELEQQKKYAVYETELQIHKAIKHTFIFISTIITFITLFVIYSLYRKRKANLILTEQKNEIQIKNKKISEQNKTLNENIIALTDALNQLKETRTQLVQSEKMASIGILTAGIAHEINNPVNFIQGGINSLTRDFKDIEIVLNEANKIDLSTGNIIEKLKNLKKLTIEHNLDEALESIPEILQDIKIGVERTTAIVKSLSSFARSDDDDFHYFNIHNSINNSLILLRSKYKNKIKIVKYFDNSIPEIKCKPNKTNQIFLNLLSNAMDAISKKGEIIITTRLLKNKISISIKDTGVGISKELQGKVFDPFYSNKPEGKGMGLGLYIVYGFIQEHNGSIDIISEPGEGSEFIITLPIA